MLWAFLAVVSAVSAGFVSLSVKAGMQNMNSDLGTFLRTLVVILFALLVAGIAGSLQTLQNLTVSGWFILISSGLCTGLSWLCYFKALQIGKVSKVVIVDRLSVVLTMTLAIIILGEDFWWLTFVCMALILTGSMLMLVKFRPSRKRRKVLKLSCRHCYPDLRSENRQECKESECLEKKNWIQNNLWLVLALLALIFASLTSILAKIGVNQVRPGTAVVDSSAAVFFRTCIVAVMAFLIVLSKNQLGGIKKMTKKNWIFLTVSGLLTGISWLCYYEAVFLGSTSVVAPIDKLSVVIAVLGARLLFKEKMSVRAWIGLVILVAGTLLLLLSPASVPDSQDFVDHRILSPGI